MGGWRHRPPQHGRRYWLHQKTVLRVDVASLPCHYMCSCRFVLNHRPNTNSYCCQIFQSFNSDNMFENIGFPVFFLIHAPCIDTTCYWDVTKYYQCLYRPKCFISVFIDPNIWHVHY